MIHKIYNVLSGEDRKKIIKEAKPYLREWSAVHPGKQTHCSLHEATSYFSFIVETIVLKMNQKTGLNLVPVRSWINWTNGKKKDIAWHDHLDSGADYSLVFYIKTPFPFFSNGTLFKHGFVRAPQNSALLFPSDLVHTAPSSPLRLSRYTLAMNLNDS